MLKLDKRQFTGCFWASGDGTIAFTEAIYGGRSPRSLPLEGIQAKYPRIVCKFTPNHWANIDTVKSATARLWHHAVAKIALRDNISYEAADRIANIVLCVDMWPVNRSAEYVTFVREKFPRIRILYIPAGATGEYQVRT